ncbi:MAG: PAS domain S-box protein [Chloroflexi bacterium]|nr:PAS domain S-box protein [Chloroflexota bacterium]
MTVLDGFFHGVLPPRFRISLALLVTVVYMAVFVALHDLVSNMVAVLAVFPVMLFGWFFGVRAGGYAGLMVALLNLLLFVVFEEAGWYLVSRVMVGSAVLAPIGIIMGWAHRLLARLQQQAGELAREREQLREQVIATEHAQMGRREAEDQYRTVVEHASDSIVVLQEGAAIFWNPACGRLLGVGPAETAPISLLDFVAPEYRARVEEYYLRRLRGEPVPDRYEVDLLAKGGGRLTVEVTPQVIDFRGRRAILVMMRDVTERNRLHRQLLESEARFRLLAESSTDLISRHAPDGTYLYASPSSFSLVGYAPEELVGRSAYDFFHPEDLAAIQQSHETILALPDTYTVAYRIRRKDGRYIWLETTSRTIRDAGTGAVQEIHAASRDITRRKAIEAALTHAQREAVEANQAKSEFLSRMSHELRTPLNAILGFAQLLQMDPLTGEQRESLEQIVRGGRHLLELINEVLDISRIEVGRLQLSPEPVPLGPLLQDVVDLVRPLAAPRELTVTTDLGEVAREHVLADHQRLKQVLLNLIHNAVKYNRPGGTVTVWARPTAEQELRIGVTDTGPGIPAELQERLFTPFERLGAERTEVEGTGLGLALSKRLVEAMGGTLGLESEVGRGSAFWVELPRVASPHVDQAPRPDKTETLSVALRVQPATVLYIEDNLSNIRLIERLLAPWPHVRLLTAMQGRLGLELAWEHRPDLVLLDLHLPDMAGDEVLRQIHQDARTEAVPVIVISADATPGQASRLLAWGARAYLTKPLDVKYFLEVVGKTLQDSRP